MSFVHLHTHSEYSLLDGQGRIKKLVAEAKRLGQPALALTDHGVMHGAIEFFRSCKEAEIKPIIGIEAYQTIWGRPMGGRDPDYDRENYHLLLLAKNMTGYRNLLKIASHSQLNGYYYRPRIDHDFLEKHAAGIIATTGCMGAEVPQLLSQGKEKEAYDRLGWYVETFGKENFFVELQEHSIEELRPINQQLVSWAGKFGIPLLATNDVHYVREEDGDPHDVLLCVQTGATVHDEKRMRLSDRSYFLKSRAQMEGTFRPFIDLPASAFDNSLLITEMCEVDLEDKNYHLPDIDIPEGFTYETYLRKLTEEGLAQLYGEKANNPEVQERKERELQIIHQMGFDVYFLIVADLCRYARSRNIWWNVRGSGAGSLVAYCTGITGIDPLKNNLIFERFLNPARVSMPDFDLDFPDDQREEMIRYTVQKYGDDQVAQIATMNRMKARAAIRDVGRAKGVPLAQVDRIAKLIPAIPGKPATIQDVLTEGHEFYNPELVELVRKDKAIQDLVETSMKLEGVARNSGVHAAAVIVADRELTHYTPLMRSSKGSITGAVTQYEFPILESIGLLKVDFLGLSTLTVMREAGRLIKERHGIEYTLANIPFEGEEAAEAFKLLSSGEVSGVFQVEGQGMRRVLTEMRPTAFEHIIATISLYRPGPMEYIPQFIRRMHGEEEVEFKHPKLEPILAETYGICVSGDAIVADARTGQRYRLDEVHQVDDLVIQGVDENWQAATGRVTHWIDSGTKQVFRVTLRNGAHIKVTADHRLLTEAGWQPLNALQPGDYIATPLQLFGPERGNGLAIDRRRLRVLAYLIADGSLASMASVDFVSKDQALIDAYVEALTVFPDVRPVFTEQVRGVTRVGNAKPVGSKLHYHTPTSLLDWMRELGLKHAAGQRPGGLRSHEKFIPAFVFELSPEEIAYFLAALWDCDGYMGRKLCHYKTISQRLAEDVQALLLRLSIPSTIHTADYENQTRGGLRHSYQVTVYDTARLAAVLQPFMVTRKREVVCAGQSHRTIQRDSFLAEVAATTPLSARALMQTYGIDRQHFYPHARRRTRISAHVVASVAQALPLPATQQKLGVEWQEIMAIEPVGEERVYDLTVEGLHSFVANNIIVHNCVYQEQIIQILSQLAGYAPGDADLVRRAVSKKKASDIEKHKKSFVAGCKQNGIPEAAAAAIYGDIEFFARYGFNKCLPGDAEVIDAATGRLIRIEDLYSGQADLHTTLMCDTNTLRFQPGLVSAVMDNGVKPVYRLTTALGRQIEATANHPFYTFEGWRLLGELQTGDQIAVPRRLPIEGKTEWPEHEVITLGHLLAEGNLCHPHSVYFYSQDPAQCDDYVRAAEQFANVECSISLHKGTYSIYAKRITRQPLPGIVSWAKALGILGKHAREKEIPASVFELTNRQIALLLSRMWEGDGHINLRGRSLYYATSSAKMARQMQHLLLRFGIISRLRTVNFPYKEGRIGYQLFVTGNENIVRFKQTIGVHFVSFERQEKLEQLFLATPSTFGVKDVVPLAVKELVRSEKDDRGVTWEALRSACGVAQREFYPTNAASKSGFTRQTIQRLADYFDSAELRRYATSDIYWDRIISIEYVGEKQTYDLEVPGTHNFVANDILVHNSHAADYAVICVQTAYLKAHYPVEYMAALLLVERDKTEKVTNFIHECRRMGIEVLPPDVNYSGLDFEIQERPADTPVVAHRDPTLGYNFPVPAGSAIRFGMAATKNVGEAPVEVILKARADGGPFTSLEDFCDRVDLRQVGKRPLECLIKVGAFDRFGRRSQLLAVLDQMVEKSVQVHNDRASGQLSMFDLLGAGGAQVTAIPLPDIEEVKGKEKLQWEKELLGVYANSHPLQQMSVDWQRVATCSCGELDERYDGKGVALAGMITNVRTINTKRGDQMAFVQIEDMQGQCEVVVFPRTYAEVKDKLIADQIYLFKGKAQTREGQTSLLLDTLQTYVDLPKVAETEPQRPLLPLMPTFNGMSFAEETAFYAAHSENGDDGEESAAPALAEFVADQDDEVDDQEDEELATAPLQEKPATAVVTMAAPMTATQAGPVNGHGRTIDDINAAFDLAAAEADDAAPEPAYTSAQFATLASQLERPAQPVAAPTVERPADNPPPSLPDGRTPPQLKEPLPPAGEPLPTGQHAAPPKNSSPPVEEPPPTVEHRGPGDGHRNGKGGLHHGRELRITFRRSGDLERDKFRLKGIYDLVCDPRGRDRFFIRLEFNGQAHELAFPNDRCTITDRLLQELQKHFRVDTVVKDQT